MATKKSANGGKKKSSGGKNAAKKNVGKSAAKKGAAKKGGAKAMSLTAASDNTCTLTPASVTILVSNCAPQAADIGSTLAQAGLISANERRAFGDCVFQAVLNAGCQINRGDIPTGADNTLRDVVFAVLGVI
jgi:hypothetical protein